MHTLSRFHSNSSLLRKRWPVLGVSHSIRHCGDTQRVKLMPPASITIVGSGKLGTALACLAGRKMENAGSTPEIQLLTRDPSIMTDINVDRVNRKYYPPTVTIPRTVRAVNNWNDIFTDQRGKESESGPHILVLAVPPNEVPSIVDSLRQIPNLPRGHELLCIWAGKGLVTKEVAKEDPSYMIVMDSMNGDYSGMDLSSEDERQGHLRRLETMGDPTKVAQFKAEMAKIDSAKASGAHPPGRTRHREDRDPRMQMKPDKQDGPSFEERLKTPFVVCEYLAHCLKCEVSILGGFNNAVEMIQDQYTEALFMSRYDILNAYGVGLFNEQPLKVFTHALDPDQNTGIPPAFNADGSGSAGAGGGARRRSPAPSTYRGPYSSRSDDDDFYDDDDDDDENDDLEEEHRTRGLSFRRRKGIPRSERKRRREAAQSEAIASSFAGAYSVQREHMEYGPGGKPMMIEPDLFMIYEYYNSLKDIICFGCGLIYANQRVLSEQMGADIAGVNITTAFIRRATLELECMAAHFGDIDFPSLDPTGLEKLRSHLKSEIASASANGYSFTMGVLMFQELSNSEEEGKGSDTSSDDDPSLTNERAWKRIGIDSSSEIQIMRRSLESLHSILYSTSTFALFPTLSALSKMAMSNNIQNVQKTLFRNS